MREALIILLVILVLFALTAFRYRKQIAAMLQVWRMLKSIKQATRPTENQINSEKAVNSRLVNCAKCGTWVPESNALKLRNTFYCSAACVERSAKVY